MGPVRGTISRTARVPVARPDLKEAAGKTLVRRTGSAYEASCQDEEANISKVQNLPGMTTGKCDGHKRGSSAHYPGRPGGVSGGDARYPCKERTARSQQRS